jgi:hypothetical protein
MSSAKSYLRAFVALACVVVSVAALINVYADNEDVIEKAKQIACVTKSCDLTRADRTPFSQTYDFRASGVQISVRCTRSLTFIGDYTCTK